MTDSDDSIAEALMLGALSTTAKSVAAVISPDTDVNMVGFEVTAGQVVDFDIDTSSNGPTGLGSYIRLFNAQGIQLASDDDGAAPGENNLGFDSYLRFTFPTSGTYYLGTSNYNNIQYSAVTGDGDNPGGFYSLGNYVLIVKALPVDLDDALSEAVATGAVSNTPITVDSDLATDIDVNMVRFSAVAGQVVEFDIDTLSNGPGGLGSFIRLFNSQGTQLAFNDDGVAPGENTIGFDSFLRYTFSTAGDYFLGVSNFNNVQYDSISGNGDTPGGRFSIGSYKLFMQTALVVIEDPNDSVSEATAIGTIRTTPTSIGASITPDTDVNIVSFFVTAGQVVDFDIDTAVNGAGGLGSFLRLFDAQGTPLAFNDDGLAPGESRLGFDAYFRYTFATAGIYYLGVSNFNNVQYNAVTGGGDTAGGLNTVGSYQLIVTGLPIDTDDSISKSVQIGTISSTPRTVDNRLVTDVDVNMVAFSVSSGQVVDFDIDTPLNGPGGLGSFIRLFNAQGQVLDFNNDAAAPGENLLGFDAYLRYTFATGGTYYLGVSNLNNSLYEPLTGNADTSGGFNSIGNYQLIIQSAPTVLSDPDDAISEAFQLGSISLTPSVVDAGISPGTDVDMVGFAIFAGQVVDFDIDTVFNGSGGLNSYLKLFDGQGQLINWNNNAEAPGEGVLGFDAYLRHTFLSAGTYYVAVSNDSNTLYEPLTGNGDIVGDQNATGTYRLIVRSVNPALGVSVNPSTISERKGSAIGTVSRSDADLSQTLVVNLTSSDPRSATVPATIIFLANQSSVNFTIAAVDDQVVSGTKTITITASVSGFSPGIGQIDITDSNSSWQNPNNPYDVDADNTVSPLDVLTIVNYLNLNGSGPITTRNPPPYLDVDSDNFVSPLDALVVINYLNARSNGEGEGGRKIVSTTLFNAVTSAVPMEFLDDYFSSLSQGKSRAGMRRGR